MGSTNYKMIKNSLKYIKNHLEEIQNDEWYKVFPISILEDTMVFDTMDEVYSLLLDANVNIDLETLFKQSYKFENYILRSKNESLIDFEDRALKQFYKETTTQLASSFNEFTFEHIIDSLRANSTIPVQDYDLSGNKDTKPTKVELITFLSRYGYPTYILKFINDKVDEELQLSIESMALEENSIYFPYGIGYNLAIIEKDIDNLIKEIEKVIK